MNRSTAAPATAPPAGLGADFRSALRSRAARLGALPLQWQLRAAYQRRAARGPDPAARPEPVEPQVVERAELLRSEALRVWRGKHAGSGWRVLFHRPPSGVGAVWFAGLMECLEHAGITCAALGWGGP